MKFDDSERDQTGAGGDIKHMLSRTQSVTLL